MPSDIERQIRALIEVDSSLLERETSIVEDDLGREYRRAYEAVLRRIELLYERYADRDGVLKYQTLISRGAWNPLYNLIKREADRLGELEERLIREGMERQLKKSYYKRIYDLARLRVIPNPKWKELTEKIINTIISFPWSGIPFSERIWGNRDNLIRHLKRELTQSMIKGEHSDKLAKTMMQRFNVGFFNAQRLTRTEMARMTYEAHRKAYKDNGVKKVMWIATLDEKTCKVCGPKDGKVYTFGEEPTVPAHPQCRCDISPIIDDEEYSVRRHNQKDESGVKPIVRGPIRNYPTFEEWREQNGIRI